MGVGGGHCCRLETSHPGLLEFPVSWHDFRIKWVGFAWSHTEYIPGDRHGWIRRYLCCPGTYPAPLAQGHGQLSYVRLKVRKHVHHRGTIRARLAAFEHATCWFGTPRDTTGIRNRRAQRHDWVWVPCCRLETSHPGLLEFPVTWHEVRMKWVGFVWPDPSTRESKVHLNGNQGTSSLSLKGPHGTALYVTEVRPEFKTSLPDWPEWPLSGTEARGGRVRS